MYPGPAAQAARDARSCRSTRRVFISASAGRSSDGYPHEMRAADYDDWITPTVSRRRPADARPQRRHPGLEPRDQAPPRADLDGHPRHQGDAEAAARDDRPAGLPEAAVPPGDPQRRDPAVASAAASASRAPTCYLLRKAHLGEVSVTVWPKELKEICASEEHPRARVALRGSLAARATRGAPLGPCRAPMTDFQSGAPTGDPHAPSKRNLSGPAREHLSAGFRWRRRPGPGLRRRRSLGLDGGRVVLLYPRSYGAGWSAGRLRIALSPGNEIASLAKSPALGPRTALFLRGGQRHEPVSRRDRFRLRRQAALLRPGHRQSREPGSGASALRLPGLCARFDFRRRRLRDLYARSRRQQSGGRFWRRTGTLVRRSGLSQPDSDSAGARHRTELRHAPSAPLRERRHRHRFRGRRRRPGAETRQRPAIDRPCPRRPVSRRRRDRRRLERAAPSS